MTSVLLSQLAMMFLLLAIGFGARKTGFLPDGASKVFSALTMYIVVPCIMISSASIPFQPQLLRGAGQIVLFSLAAHGLPLYCIWAAARRRPHADASSAVFACLVSLPNIIFLGLPIVSTFLPETGGFYAAVYNVGYNVIFFTLGVRAVRGRGAFSPRSLLRNLPLWATLAMLLLFAFQIQLPGAVSKAVSSMASMGTPLALLVIGCDMADENLLSLFSSGRSYWACAIRLLAVPAAAFAVLKVLPLQQDVALAVFVFCGLPCGTMSAMLAAEAGKEHAAFASKTITLSTLLYALTLPLMSLLIPLL